METLLALGFTRAESERVTVESTPAIIALVSDNNIPIDYSAPVYIETIEGARPALISVLGRANEVNV